MFRTLIITSAIAIAAVSSIGAAEAKAVVFNYPDDPCRSAAFNAAQAQWQESHTTDKGNLGGAAGWDELADQAQQSADRATASAKNHRQAAKDNPKSADFWNKQAADAERDAADWQKSADKYKDEAQKMRDEGKEFADAAKKNLEECLPRLIAMGPVASQVHLSVIASGLERVYGDSLDEPAKAEEPAPEEKKEPKKTSSTEPSPPKQYYSVEPQYFVGLPRLYIEDGEVAIWDGWHGEHDHDGRHHRRYGNDHNWTDGDRDELPRIDKDRKLSKKGDETRLAKMGKGRDELPKIDKDRKLTKIGKEPKLAKMGENRSVEKMGKNRKLGKNGGMGKLAQQSSGSDRKIGKMMGGGNKMMGGKRKRKLTGFGL